ncbi:Transposase and inactivated derivatives [Lysinibacillus sphaericus]|nr:Transposase and inactivated derivatives [Lysinibacillus sphaericus]VDG98718.1 Transposase and inactivated derivatives [Lysinibacillus sphaericus]VDH00362.1 Transposase and inactivated derivatives [Lysinibacillus sphaericus]
MYIAIPFETGFEVNSLKDLSKFKQIMESLKMKINKSELARELGVDRRTIDKYLNGFIPKRTREKASKIDELYPVIAALLCEDSKQKFYYRRVLWQYLKDNHGLNCADSTFRSYIAKTPEFQAYFEEDRRIPSPKGTVRFETPAGKQAQLDWKESILYETSDGAKVEVNVGVLILSHSRLRSFLLTVSKSQPVLLSFLTETFEALGGVPLELITDNMKTVMDEARTEYSAGRVNTKFAQFAKDFGFTVKPCIAGRPRTKGKVETTMKLLDEIHAYQGKFTLEELHQFIQDLCRRVNHQVHQGTGKIPILEYKKEKNLLSQLPTEQIRGSYKIKQKLVKVNASNMITYKSNQYSVPAKYQGKKVGLQVYEDYLWIHYNTRLIARHPISSAKLNYKEEHYQEALSVSMPDYPDIDELAKRNLAVIGEVYKS